MKTKKKSQLVFGITSILLLCNIAMFACPNIDDGDVDGMVTVHSISKGDIDPKPIRSYSLDQLVADLPPLNRENLRKSKDTELRECFIVNDFRVTQKQYDDNLVVAMIEKGDSAYRVFHTIKDDTLQIGTSYNFLLKTMFKYDFKGGNHSVVHHGSYYGEDVESVRLLGLNALDSVASIQRVMATSRRGDGLLKQELAKLQPKYDISSFSMMEERALDYFCKYAVKSFDDSVGIVKLVSDTIFHKWKDDYFYRADKENSLSIWTMLGASKNNSDGVRRLSDTSMLLNTGEGREIKVKVREAFLVYGVPHIGIRVYDDEMRAVSDCLILLNSDGSLRSWCYLPFMTDSVGMPIRRGNKDIH